MVTIEVSGETNPLSLQNVVNSLVLAASSNPQQVQTGTKQLQNWERLPTYHAFLQVRLVLFEMMPHMKLTCDAAGRLLRSICTSRGPLPLYNPTEERNRQILA